MPRYAQGCPKIKIWSYSFMIEMKVVRNVILNNIDLHDQPFRMHRSPPRCRQNFTDSKNSKIWQIWLRYFIFDHRVFCSRWNCKIEILRKKKKLTDLISQHEHTTPPPLLSPAYRVMKVFFSQLRILDTMEAQSLIVNFFQWWISYPIMYLIYKNLLFVPDFQQIKKLFL